MEKNEITEKLSFCTPPNNQKYTAHSIRLSPKHHKSSTIEDTWGCSVSSSPLEELVLHQEDSTKADGEIKGKRIESACRNC